MKDHLERIQREVSQLMQERLAGGKFDQIESLTPMLTKAGKLRVRIDEIEMEITTLENGLKAIRSKTPVGTGESTHDNYKTEHAERGDGRAAPSTIRILINWGLNNRQRDEEEIFDPIAANGLATFISRMISEFKDQAIQQLLKIKINRGPLISRSPRNDFGKYQSKRVPGTDLFVLTNNTTIEKVEIVKLICRELKLVPGSVIVEAEKRF